MHLLTDNEKKVVEVEAALLGLRLTDLPAYTNCFDSTCPNDALCQFVLVFSDAELSWCDYICACKEHFARWKRYGCVFYSPSSLAITDSASVP